MYKSKKNDNNKNNKDNKNTVGNGEDQEHDTITLNELRVRMRHFEEAMSKIRPLSEQEFNWYKTIAKRFGKRHRTRLRSEEIKSGIGGGIS